MRTRIITTFLVAMGCVLLAGSAMAQMAVNPVSENQWNRYLANHPNVQAGMVNDPNYLAQHPGIADWLHKHPDVAAYQRQQNQYGGWDTHNQYHDRHWWQSHDPSWVQTHHPEWAQNNPNYMNHPNYANNPNYAHPAMATRATMTQRTNGTIAAGGWSTIIPGSRNITRIGSNRTSIDA